MYKNPEDVKAYAALRYEVNKEVIKARAKIHSNREKIKIRAWVLEYLLGHPCVDCPESDPIVLEFDHRPEEKKRFAIADFCNKGMSLKSVIAEVAKCDVRCANCHRKMTYRRAGLTNKTVHQNVGVA